MSVGSIIYLTILLLFFIGGFIFFIAMDLTREKRAEAKTKKKSKTKK